MVAVLIFSEGIALLAPGSKKKKFDWGEMPEELEERTKEDYLASTKLAAQAKNATREQAITSQDAHGSRLTPMGCLTKFDIAKDVALDVMHIAIEGHLSFQPILFYLAHKKWPYFHRYC